MGSNNQGQSQYESYYKDQSMDSTVNYWTVVRSQTNPTDGERWHSDMELDIGWNIK